MGENAIRKSDGQNIKIGTCESMYYLRFSQRGDVDYRWPELSNDPENLEPFIYRFPDPKEDGILPGEYDSSWGGVDLSIPGFWNRPGMESVEHGIIQATAHGGFLFNLPCPEGNPDNYKGPYGKAPQLHRNGGSATVRIIAQRWYAGHLATVVQCVACGHVIRLPEKSDALPILEALERKAKAEQREAETYYGRNRDQVMPGMLKQASYYVEVANRILAGYDYTA